MHWFCFQFHFNNTKSGFERLVWNRAANLTEIKLEFHLDPKFKTSKGVELKKLTLRACKQEAGMFVLKIYVLCLSICNILHNIYICNL